MLRVGRHPDLQLTRILVSPRSTAINKSFSDMSDFGDVKVQRYFAAVGQYQLHALIRMGRQ